MFPERSFALCEVGQAAAEVHGQSVEVEARLNHDYFWEQYLSGDSKAVDESGLVGYASANALR